MLFYFQQTMPLTFYKTKKLRFIFIGYWFLLVYIIAALVWWFIELNNQNHQMATITTYQILKDNPGYYDEVAKVKQIEKRKTAQYIGEGAVFLLVIIAGAVYVFRAVRRQLKLGQQQQNFMMAITHELKTPITIAKLNLETLQKRKLDESQSQKLIHNTIQEANRLNALCNNLLLVAQLEDSKYHITEEAINFSELIAGCVDDFKMRYPDRIYITSLAENIFINGDRTMLQMAVNNLIDNASKYADKAAIVNVSVQQELKKIKFTVADNGKGIADEDKTKIFEKFYRVGNKATKEAKGTGLGLYLSKKIAEQHHAVISITDNVPQGSIFTIIFKQ